MFNKSLSNSSTNWLMQKVALLLTCNVCVFFFFFSGIFGRLAAIAASEWVRQMFWRWGRFSTMHSGAGSLMTTGTCMKLRWCDSNWKLWACPGSSLGGVPTLGQEGPVSAGGCVLYMKRVF